MADATPGRHAIAPQITAILREIATSDADPKTLARLILERTQALLDSDGALLEWRQSEEAVSRMGSGIMEAEAGRPSSLLESISRQLAPENEILFCDEAQTDTRLDRDLCAALGIRAIVAAPLRYGYNKSGTLRVFFLRPRLLGADLRLSLDIMIGVLEHCLNQAATLDLKQALLAENARTILSLRESEVRFRSAFDFAAIGMALVGLEGRWIKVNYAACKILGYSEPEFRYQTFFSLFHPHDLPEQERALQGLLGGVASSFQKETRVYHGSGAVVWILVSVSLLRDNQGKASYFVVQMQDITERKQSEDQVKNSLREKEVLLKEIHHRVKNNLQVISSLLSLQSGDLRDPQMIELFHESQNRVRTMALIHERLYQSEDLSKIDFGDYVKSLLAMLFRSYTTAQSGIKLETKIDPAELSIDTAIPLGLSINELVSNSLKHAFPNHRAGIILIEFREESPDNYRLHYRDNGVGVPADFELDKARSLGLRLVRTLTSQIGGALEFQRNDGIAFTITFREPKDKGRT